MYTRCPTCSTCFRVTDRHLAIANGKVRCGQCKLVFNAPEHAIDDLPVSQLTENKHHQPIPSATPPPKSKVEKIETPTQKIEPAALAPTAKEKREQNFDSINIEKEETTAIEEPIFDVNATMVADMSSVSEDELDNIDLDISDVDASSHEAPVEEQNDLDDVFNNDVDLDVAINQLTKATEEAVKAEDNIEDEDSITELVDDYSTPKENNADVFTTDAYDATEASSVTDILNEMEGQLSLNITDPEQPSQKDDTQYDANNEFDFIQLDDENTNSIIIGEEQSETNDDTLKNHFNLDEFGIDDELDALIEEDKENDKEKNIDADELFNQIDISDFQDSDIEDEITLEETSSENSGFANTPAETNVPFQLRNDIESLQTSSKRRIHPLITFSFFIFLLVLSFSQLAYFQSHALIKAIPEARPLLVQLCEKIDCHYSGPVDKKKIQLVSRDVRLHPKEKKALLISAAMINNAQFAQPNPNIHIRLSDISGNIIAERLFNAKTYMGKLSNPFLLMKSKTPVHINFEVVDPGKDAINFEFTFL